MKYLLIILLTTISNVVYACNCPPPFPNFNPNAKPETKLEQKTRKNQNEFAVVVKIIDSRDITLQKDISQTRKKYRKKLKEFGIKRKKYSFKDFAWAESYHAKMREYRAVIVLNLKEKEIKTDTINILAYLHNGCGLSFKVNEYYGIGGWKMSQYKYKHPRILGRFYKKRLIPESYQAEPCSIAYDVPEELKTL